MRLKCALIGPISLYLIVSFQAGVCARPSDRCAFPPGLHDEISMKYPGARVVTSGDLDKYHRKLFKKDHGARCPGRVKVDFYGDGKPTWAVVLMSGEGSKQKAKLVVAHQLAEDWELRLLETTDTAPVPVVWRQEPGEYHGMSEPKTIRAGNPVIVLCGYESWAILYAWTGSEVQKTWISD